VSLPVRPALRRELRIVADGKNGMLRFDDPCGYVRPDLEFEPEFAALFDLLDGSLTIGGLLDLLRTRFDSSISMSHVRQLLKWFDEELLLDSPQFASAQRFFARDAIDAACAGSVYPADPAALKTYLDGILDSVPATAYPQHARAAFIPHIDFRVAAQHYAYPFNALRRSEFDLIIHIGTSHYGWQDRFLLTTKDFNTPLGRIKTNRQLVEALRQKVGLPLTYNELAYRPEHALELHHVFIQHLFPHREYTVLPILVTSFHDYVHRSEYPISDAKFSAFCNALSEVVRESGLQPLILISGDLAHIGRRFGDHWDAVPMLDRLRGEDYEILNAIACGSSRQLFTLIAQTGDARRICGFPPALTFLEAFAPGKGLMLDYGQWNDLETKSAVSFGSIVWY